MGQILLFSLLISLGINFFFFAFASAFKTDKLTDFTYGLSFILLVLFFFWRNQSFFLYQWLVILMVSLWALRLITYLLVRILKIKKDRRFDGMRENFIKFLGFWTFQGISVWVISWPSLYLLTRSSDYSLTNPSYLGIGIYLFALIFETIADWQKFTFKNKEENKGKWIESGLWHYSRHPNYFGEMLVWWGIFIFTLPFLQWQYAWLVFGPIFITLILLFVSGVPLLEKRYEKKYGKNKDYLAYKRRTSLLIPWFVKD